MKIPRPSREVLQAWHEAGHAVCALAYGIKVHWISIDRPARALRTITELSIEPRDVEQATSASVIQRVERFVIVRLAGPVGEMLWQERFNEISFGWNNRRERTANAMRRLQRCDVSDADFDVAWACTVGWLANQDEGDPYQTVVRLWKRADRLLRKPDSQLRLHRLASRLLEVRELTGEELEQLFA